MTDALKTVYAANLLTDRVLDTVALSHSTWTKVYYLVADTQVRQLKDENGTIHDYEPFGFRAIQPSKGSNQQDLQLAFDNVIGLGTAELNKAIKKSEEPIKCVYCTYLVSSQDPQISPIHLELASISLTAYTIIATAQRRDLYQNKVPKKKFDSHVYRGIS